MKSSLWFGVFYLPLLLNAIVLSINFCFDYKTWFMRLIKGKHNALLLLLCLLCYFFLFPHASVFLFLNQFLFYLKFLQSILKSRLLVKNSLVFLCFDCLSVWFYSFLLYLLIGVELLESSIGEHLSRLLFIDGFHFRLFVLSRNESTYVSFYC